jgi:adenylate cyclase
VSEGVVARARHRFAGFLLPETGTIRLPAWLLVSALGAVVGVGLSATDTAQRLDWASYDRLLSATRDTRGTVGVVVVAIDEPSATELGRAWPWPRRWHAQLIDQLARGGARAIVLDIVFEAPGVDPEDDEALARAFRAAGNVVLASDLVETANRAYGIAQWVEPHVVFREAAAAVGAARITPDPDGVVRRTALQIEGRATLAAAAANVAKVDIPSDGTRARLIGFAGPPGVGVKTVSYYQALDATALLPAGIFAGQVVFVGRAMSIAADVDVPDHYPTPVGRRTPGVEIHASAFDTIARQREVRDPLGTLTTQGIATFLAALIASLALRRLSPAAGLVAVAGAAAALVAIAWWALTEPSQVRLPTVGPVLAIAVTFATTSAHRYAVGARERRTIRRAFQHYVSPSVVDLLLRDPARLKLGGEDCEVTVLFTDLEGFTAMSEHLVPEVVRTRLSEHFTAMVDALLAEGATLDKFIGDSVMAYFGAPVPMADHASRACAAALSMQRRMSALSTAWVAAGLPRVRMRVGINSGRVVAGNMGTARVFNYTVIGDTVNLASRLEGVNKTYGTGIVVGDRTRTGAGEGFVFRELDLIRVQGRARPVAVHELLGRSGGVDAMGLELVGLYAGALACYRGQDWNGAERGFRAALALDARDSPSAVMLARTLDYAATPPGPAWDGVHVMRAK